MPFIRRYRGGIYPVGQTPPRVRFFVLFVLFSFALFFSLDRQRSFQTKEPYIIVSWDRPASEERSFVAIE